MKFEIEITRQCNFACNGCDRLCNIIKDNESNMSLDNIELIAQQINNVANTPNVPIEHITIIGGEPTLNAQCYDICKCLKNNVLACKTFNLATNHTNNELAYRIGNDLDFNVRYDDNSNDPKEIVIRKHDKHINILLSPLEEHLEVNDPKMCWVMNNCGISIHKYNGQLKWCWCGAGTSICKLLQREDFMKSSLSELLNSDIQQYFNVICQNCMYLCKTPVRAVDTKDYVSKCFQQGLHKLNCSFPLR